MSDEIDLEAQITREGEAISDLNDLILKFNSDEHPDSLPIEESLLIYLVTRMAASADGDSGKEHYSREDILGITNASVEMGKDVIEQGRRDGTLPRPFKLVKPKGLH